MINSNKLTIGDITQDYDAPFLIENGELIEGEFPLKAKNLVKEFILKNKQELEEMWETVLAGCGWNIIMMIRNLW